VDVADRLVLPALSQEDIAAIASGRHQMDAFVRRYIHENLSYGFAMLSDGAAAYVVETTLKNGEWVHGRPRANVIHQRRGSALAQYGYALKVQENAYWAFFGALGDACVTIVCGANPAVQSSCPLYPAWSRVLRIGRVFRIGPVWPGGEPSLGDGPALLTHLVHEVATAVKL